MKKKPKPPQVGDIVWKAIGGNMIPGEIIGIGKKYFFVSVDHKQESEREQLWLIILCKNTNAEAARDSIEIAARSLENIRRSMDNDLKQFEYQKKGRLDDIKAIERKIEAARKVIVKEESR